MRRGGGKNKGAAQERLVAKQLSLWISKGKHEDLYWRSSMSGGRSTVAFKRGVRLAAQAGDISCVNPLGRKLTDKFLIEIKFYKNLVYHGLITQKGHLVEFWHEVQKQASRYDKSPMLIARQNQLPAVICLTRTALRGFNVRPVLIAPKLDLAIALFDDFLKDATPP